MENKTGSKQIINKQKANLAGVAFIESETRWKV
jgi:hypothetical protein